MLNKPPRIAIFFPRLGDRFLLRNFLEEKGCVVFEELPSEGDNIDAILLDLSIGNPTLEKILAFKKKCPDFLPLVALMSRKVKVNLLYKMGFDDCWIYPILKEQLWKRLKFYLELREKVFLLKKEEEKKRLEALGFVAIGIAHDFNNMLTPILGYTDICRIKLEKQSYDIDAYLARIRESVFRAKELIDQIFSFCNPQFDTEEIINLTKEVSSLASFLEPSIPSGINFNVLLPSENYFVAIKRSKFQRIFTNLISNAVKVLGDRGTISVRLFKEGEKVCLEVSDTGKGIDAKAKEKLFNLFYSSEGTSGLGLNIVKSLLDEVGGEIIFTSEPGEGTTFKVTLPLKESIAEKKTLLEDLSCKSHVSRLSANKVLIIDDELTIVELFKQFLSLYDLEILTANSGREALELFKQYKDELKLVISDYYLPDITGDKLLRGMQTERKDLAFILCTGLRENILESLERPKDMRLKILRKPFSFAELQKVLEEFDILTHQETAA